jgi:hypothetical protein
LVKNLLEEQKSFENIEREYNANAILYNKLYLGDKNFKNTFLKHNNLKK